LNGIVPIPSTRVDLTPHRDELYDRILDAIVTGELPPGARLAEPALAARFDAPRAALREAMHRLAAVGMIDVAPRQSTQVALIDPGRTRDTFAVVHAVVAQGIAEGTPMLTDEDRARLVRYRSTALADEASTREAIRTNAVTRELYGVFFERIANPEYERLRSWLNPTLLRINAQFADELDAAASRRHQRAVVAGALAGDTAAALAAWEANATAHLPAALARVGSDAATLVAAPSPLIRDRAAELVQRSILDGTLVPGEILHESALMEWMNISRTPVREALARLAALGLVEQVYHRPARVATLDPLAFQQAMRATGLLRRLALREGFAHDPGGTTAAVADAVTELDRGASVVEAATTMAARVEVLTSNAVLVELVARSTARVRWYILHDPAVSATLNASLVRDLHAALVAGDVDRADALVDQLYTVDANALTQPQESA
jgi:DNA-binding GntR family transcriptional regulator